MRTVSGAVGLPPLQKAGLVQPVTCQPRLWTMQLAVDQLRSSLEQDFYAVQLGKAVLVDQSRLWEFPDWVLIVRISRQIVIG